MGVCNCKPRKPRYGRKYKESSIQEISQDADSGDLFLAAGKGKWSNVVRVFSKSPLWSHVGIFVRDEQGELMILDADNSGVKFLTFEEYIARYNGYYIGFRSLKGVTDTKRVEYGRILLEFEREIRGGSYSLPTVLARSIGRLNTDDYPVPGYMYCAQLVIECYRRLKLIENEICETSSNSQLNDFTTLNGMLKYYTSNIVFNRHILVAKLGKRKNGYSEVPDE
jgi:hypothetical protein